MVGSVRLPGAGNATVSREGGVPFTRSTHACSLDSGPSTAVPACGWGHVNHTRRPPALMVFSLPRRAALSEGRAPCQAVLLRVEQRCRPEHAGEGGAQDPAWAGGRHPLGFHRACAAARAGGWGGPSWPLWVQSPRRRRHLCAGPRRSQQGGRLLAVFEPVWFPWAAHRSRRGAPVGCGHRCALACGRECPGASGGFRQFSRTEGHCGRGLGWAWAGGRTWAPARGSLASPPGLSLPSSPGRWGGHILPEAP